MKYKCLDAYESDNVTIDIDKENDKQISDNHFISASKLGHCWAAKLRMIHFCSGLCVAAQCTVLMSGI